MTPDDITALRRQACGLITVLGVVLDSLQTIDETLATPTPHARDVDSILISQQLNEAAENALTLAGSAAEFADGVNAAHREALLGEPGIDPLPDQLEIVTADDVAAIVHHHALHAQQIGEASSVAGSPLDEHMRAQAGMHARWANLLSILVVELRRRKGGRS